ncbi:Putative replication origin-binding protein (OBP) [Durusdinium trenchii]|uniref:Replication origin-binding protein (OBP) n=1 Tax=Durusdinium trenchii TaxID=1381693 RepID=A0ABP0L9E5_9DINO
MAVDHALAEVQLTVLPHEPSDPELGKLVYNGAPIDDELRRRVPPREGSIAWFVALGMNPNGEKVNHRSTIDRRDKHTGREDMVPWFRSRGHAFYTRASEKRGLKAKFGRRYTGDGGRDDEIHWKSTPLRWEATPAERAAGGLLLTNEYNKRRPLYDEKDGTLIRRPSMLCVLARHFSLPRNNRYERSSNVYTIVNDEASMTHLMRQDGPANRHYDEHVFSDTPHRFFLDIEKDLDDPATSSARIKAMRRGLATVFVPVLIKFFRKEFGLALAPRNFFVTDASLVRVKFSTHVVIVPDDKNYFRTRADSFVAAVLLEQFCREESTVNPVFREWYFTSDAREETVVDWSIYGVGARGMRMPGSCKLSNLYLGTNLSACRVFVPTPARYDDNWQDYMVSAYSSVGVHPKIHVTDAKCEAAIAYINECRRSNTVAAPAFKNIANALRISGKFGSSTLPIASSLPGVVSSRPGVSAWTTPTDRILQDIRESSRGPTAEMDDFDRSIAEQAKAQYERYCQIAHAILLDVARAIHPDADVTDARIDEDDCVASLQFRPKCNVDGATPRLCYHGCYSESSGHYVVLKCTADFAVTYFCHRCRETKVVLRSPLRNECAMEANTSDHCPVDMKPGRLDYALLGPPDYDAGEKDIYMRHIRPFPDTKRYYDDPQRKATVVLHGGMGTGKTQTTKAYLANLRAEHPEVSVLAISFRRMLASMFASAFGLTNYTDPEVKGKIGRCDNLAVQLESLHKVIEWQPRQDIVDDLEMEETHGYGSRVMGKLERVWDVLVIDEVESVIEQFNSDTMRNKIELTHFVLSVLVREAKVLIVADADIGYRTWWFLRKYRSNRNTPFVADILRTGDNVCPIPALQYHRNHHVAISTTYIEHAGEWEFLKQLLVDLIDKRKRVFFFSNAAAHMAHVREFILREIHARLDQVRRTTVEDWEGDEMPEEMDFLSDLATAVYMISAKTSNSQKLTATNCNVTWCQFRLLMISPTVGAGIDFSEEHFDVAYGYGSSKSNTARGLMQMKGRVRRLRDKVCHLFLPDSPSPQGNPATNRPRNVNDAILQHDNERKNHISGIMDLQRVINGAMIFSAHVAPRDLVTLRALNTVAQNKSAFDFRRELLNVIQNADPDAEYRFDSACDIARNQSLVAHFHAIRDDVDKKDRTILAAQKDVNPEDYKTMKALDEKGAAPEDETAPILERNKFRHFYGIDEGVGEKDFEEIYEAAQGNKACELVSNMTSIMYTSTRATMKRSRDYHGVHMRSLELPGGREKKLQMAGDDLDETHFHRRRLWCIELFFLAGYEVPIAQNPDPDHYGIIHGNYVSHPTLCYQRIADNPEMLSRVKQGIHLYTKKKGGKGTEVYVGEHPTQTPKRIQNLAKNVLLDWFGINCVKKQPGNKDIPCPDHHSRIKNPFYDPEEEDRKLRGREYINCNCAKSLDGSLEAQLRRTRARLTVLAKSKNECLKRSLDLVTEQCEALNTGHMAFTRGKTRSEWRPTRNPPAPLPEPQNEETDLEEIEEALRKRRRTMLNQQLPGLVVGATIQQESQGEFDPIANFVGTAATEEEEDEEHDQEEDDHSALESDVSGHRKRKRSKDAAKRAMKSRYDVIAKEWPDIKRRYVGRDPYTEMSATEFVGNLLTRTMKLRTRFKSKHDVDYRTVLIIALVLASIGGLLMWFFFGDDAPLFLGEGPTPPATEPPQEEEETGLSAAAITAIVICGVIVLGLLFGPSIRLRYKKFVLLNELRRIRGSGESTTDAEKRIRSAAWKDQREFCSKYLNDNGKRHPGSYGKWSDFKSAYKAQIEEKYGKEAATDDLYRRLHFYYRGISFKEAGYLALSPNRFLPDMSRLADEIKKTKLGTEKAKRLNQVWTDANLFVRSGNAAFRYMISTADTGYAFYTYDELQRNINEGRKKLRMGPVRITLKQQNEVLMASKEGNWFGDTNIFPEGPPDNETRDAALGKKEHHHKKVNKNLLAACAVALVTTLVLVIVLRNGRGEEEGGYTDPGSGGNEPPSSSGGSRDTLAIALSCAAVAIAGLVFWFLRRKVPQYVGIVNEMEKQVTHNDEIAMKTLIAFTAILLTLNIVSVVKRRKLQPLTIDTSLLKQFEPSVVVASISMAALTAAPFFLFLDTNDPQDMHTYVYCYQISRMTYCQYIGLVALFITAMLIVSNRLFYFNWMMVFSVSIMAMTLISLKPTFSVDGAPHILAIIAGVSALVMFMLFSGRGPVWVLLLMLIPGLAVFIWYSQQDRRGEVVDMRLGIPLQALYLTGSIMPVAVFAAWLLALPWIPKQWYARHFIDA